MDSDYDLALLDKVAIFYTMVSVMIIFTHSDSFLEIEGSVR